MTGQCWHTPLGETQAARGSSCLTLSKWPGTESCLVQRLRAEPNRTSQNKTKTQQNDPIWCSSVLRHWCLVQLSSERLPAVADKSTCRDPQPNINLYVSIGSLLSELREPHRRGEEELWGSVGRGHQRACPWTNYRIYMGSQKLKWQSISLHGLDPLHICCGCLVWCLGGTPDSGGGGCLWSFPSSWDLFCLLDCLVQPCCEGLCMVLLDLEVPGRLLFYFGGE